MRIFSVRINLDEMSAQLETCDSDTEKLQWLSGFRAGCRGLTAQTHWPLAKTTGAQFGLDAYHQAVAFSQRQTVRANQRWKPPACHGNATAMPDSCHGNAISSNRVIQQSNNPGNEGTTRAGATPTPEFFDGMDGDETPIALAAPMARELNWRDWRSQHGAVFVARRGDDGDMEGWEEAWKVYGLEIFNAMYAALNAPGKKIYFNNAIMWFEENTKDVV